MVTSVLILKDLQLDENITIFAILQAIQGNQDSKQLDVQSEHCIVLDG